MRNSNDCYSENYIQKRIKELKNYFNENLREGFTLHKISYDTTYGLSIYVHVAYEKDDERMFSFRISDHSNGCEGEIIDSGLSLQVQGKDLYAMYIYYGLSTKEEAHYNILKEELKNAKKANKKDTYINFLEKEIGKAKQKLDRAKQKR